MLTSTRPKHGTQTAPVYPKGRICRTCTAYLSIYNGRDRCSKCRPEGRQLVALTRQHERQAFADMILEVMEEESP